MIFTIVCWIVAIVIAAVAFQFWCMYQDLKDDGY